MKRGLMRLSGTTRDLSFHVKPGHTNRASGTAVTEREAENLPGAGTFMHISASQQPDC